MGEFLKCLGSYKVHWQFNNNNNKINFFYNQSGLYSIQTWSPNNSMYSMKSINYAIVTIGQHCTRSDWLGVVVSVSLGHQGSHPTWKTWKTWNFVIFFSRPGKCLEFAHKVVKTWNFNSKPGKNMKFANSMFQASFFKMSFTKIILIYFFVISTLSTQTLI